MPDGDRVGQWEGDSFLQSISPSAVGGIISLLPTAPTVGQASNVVFERSIITFQTRRVGNGVLEGLAFLIWKGNVLSGTTTPVEALDPLSQSTFSWAHKSIMQFGVLKVPAAVFNDTGQSLAISQELTAEMVDINVKRSVNRRNETINLLVAADAASVVKCNITFRTYYTYAT